MVKVRNKNNGKKIQKKAGGVELESRNKCLFVCVDVFSHPSREKEYKITKLTGRSKKILGYSILVTF